MTLTFLDVGGHEGQTLEEATKPRWPFDRIHCLEPMPAQFDLLRDRFPDVTVHPFGLAAETGPRTLYGSNAGMESSIYSAKNDVDSNVETDCFFVAASQFVRYWCPTGDLVVKLNCEGAEIEILDDLIDSGSIWRCANVMIDFDIRKVPGEEHHEQRILSRLRGIGFDRFSLCDDVMRGDTHQDRIANWLGGVL